MSTPRKRIGTKNLSMMRKVWREEWASEQERQWLKFIGALVETQRRHDVEIEERCGRVDGADIEIECPGPYDQENHSASMSNSPALIRRDAISISNPFL